MLSIVAHKRLPGRGRQHLFAVESVRRPAAPFFAQMGAGSTHCLEQSRPAFLSVKRCVDGGLIDLGWIDLARCSRTCASIRFRRSTASVVK
jgi:hypothetical protein